MAIVFGNEALGVSEEVLARCERLVQIPTHGYKDSVNVATAAAVIGCRVLSRTGFG